MWSEPGMINAEKEGKVLLGSAVGGHDKDGFHSPALAVRSSEMGVEEEEGEGRELSRISGMLSSPPFVQRGAVGQRKNFPMTLFAEEKKRGMEKSGRENCSHGQKSMGKTGQWMQLAIFRSSPANR